MWWLSSHLLVPLVVGYKTVFLCHPDSYTVTMCNRYLVSSHVVTVQLPTRCLVLVDRFLHRPHGSGKDLSSDPSTRLFRRAIVIFDGQKINHDGFVYRRAKWKLVKYLAYICTSFYKNGKNKPVSSINWIKYHLLNDNYSTKNIIRRP